MKNDLLNYMIKNKNMLMVYALKYGAKGCKGKAEDIYQESLRYVTSRVKDGTADENFKSLKACAVQIIRHRGFNSLRVNEKYEYGMTDTYDLDVFESGNSVEDMDLKMDFQKIMKVAKEILPKKQYQALIITLKEDKIMVETNNRSGETMKANRRHAIMKLREHFTDLKYLKGFRRSYE